jgi:hypothetical protein
MISGNELLIIVGPLLGIAAVVGIVALIIARRNAR